MAKAGKRIPTTARGDNPARKAARKISTLISAEPKSALPSEGKIEEIITAELKCSPAAYEQFKNATPAVAQDSGTFSGWAVYDPDTTFLFRDDLPLCYGAKVIVLIADKRCKTGWKVLSTGTIGTKFVSQG